MLKIQMGEDEGYFTIIVYYFLVIKNIFFRGYVQTKMLLMEQRRL